MYDKLYALGDVWIALFFSTVTFLCFVGAPYVGQKLGWTVPNKDRADYVVRAQATVISFTALILAFSLVQVQGNLRKTDEMVATEAATLSSLDRLLLRYGDTETSDLRPLLWMYTSSIIQDEWPALNRGERSRRTTEAFRSVSRGVFGLTPATGRQNAIYGELIKSVDQAADQREMRINATELKLPGAFWMLALVLGLIMVGLSLAIEPLPYHTFSIAAQGVAIALLAALVFSTDRPFNGDTAVQPDALEKVLVIMKERT